MELRKIAVAIAALSFAAAAGAHGDKSASNASSSTSSNYSTDQSSGGQRSQTMAMNDESTVRSAQQALKDKGFDPGAADGKAGAQTQSAVRQFQQAQGLPQTGALDSQTIAALGVEQGATPGTSGATDQGSTSSSSGASPSGSSGMSSPGSASSPSSSSSTSSGTQGSSYGSSSGTPAK